MPIADAPAQPPASAHHARARWDHVERGVFRAVNRTRRRHGLPRLRLVYPITFMAKLHSLDLVRHGRLSHTSTDGTPFYRRIRHVADARAVGETIIGYRGRSTGRRIVGAWMRSPSHRRELLTGSYRRIGVGRAAARGRTVVTADFASR